MKTSHSLTTTAPMLLMGLLMAATLALLTACGGGDSDSSVYGSNDSNRLVGNFAGSTFMNGFEVTNKINIDAKGNVLGIAFNTQANAALNKTVYTITKGNLNSAKLYEFDLLEPSINRYDVSSRKQNNGDSIVFSFSNVPLGLNRPSSQTVNRLPSNSSDIYLADLKSVYNTTTIDLSNLYASDLHLYATTRPDEVKFIYRDYRDTGQCQLEGFIIKQTYQTNMLDVEGRFSGAACQYNGQKFEGLLTRLYPNQDIVIFGATEYNSNAMMITPSP